MNSRFHPPGTFYILNRKESLGLAGTANSTDYRIAEIERHFHSPSHCYGKSADQSGNDWALSAEAAGMPTAFRAISGSAAFGADANDEAKIIGTDDTGMTGMTKFDLHEISISAASVTTDYVLRLVWGTGTMADAITAGQTSTIIVRRNPGGGEDHLMPIVIQMGRLSWGIDKVWIQAKNATDNATIDFFIGLHEYSG